MPHVSSSSSNVSDTVAIDVAVLCQEYSPVDVMCTNINVIELNEMVILAEVFKSIFYPYGENFGIDCDKIRNNPHITPYITFLPPWRTFDCGKPFSLLEQIILNLENDLNVSRNCFTTSSLIELSRELSNIKTLCDLKCCSLVSSLPWSNVVSIFKTDSKTRAIPIKYALFIVSVIFKTPNLDVRPTIIKFKYRVEMTDLCCK